MTDQRPADFFERCPDCRARWGFAFKSSRETHKPLDLERGVTVDMASESDDTPPWGLYDWPHGYRIKGKVLAADEVSSAKRPVVCYPPHRCLASRPAPGAPSGKDAAAMD